MAEDPAPLTAPDAGSDTDGADASANASSRRQPAADERAGRLAAALRENLRRRKAQARARAAETQAPCPAEPSPEEPAACR